MLKRNSVRVLGLLITTAGIIFSCSGEKKINRQVLVERHTVKLNTADTLASLTVGNGSFAFTADITGLQTFPEFYAKGVPLGTQSEWGWHSFPNTEKYRFEETLKDFDLNGRPVSYSVQVKEPERSKKAVDYFRMNPHRLFLGNLGFEITKKDGSKMLVTDVKDIQQELNLFTGQIHSQFTIEGEKVEVITYGHQQEDLVAVKVNSALIEQKRLKINIRFPYPTGAWGDFSNHFSNPDKHTTTITGNNNTSATIQHSLDTTTYFVQLQWNNNAAITTKEAHYFVVSPEGGNSFELSARFAPRANTNSLPDFTATAQNSTTEWKKFWSSGGAIDFEGSTDSRAKELERRIVLSQYLTKVQCSGNYPPQETGLTYNSWYGRPHLEMHWWHGVHFALWGRPELLEKSLNWYLQPSVYANAKKIAERQKYDGVRWQKMTDNAGEEGPSSVGAFLIWQQPHFIYFSELIYRAKNDEATLNKYKDYVFATADFMASYPHFDSVTGKYNLGKGVIPAQERFKAVETFNPTYELVYWRWALQTAQQWRERLKLERNKKWDEVLEKLAPLPTQGDKYLFTESGTDSYTNPVYKTDHMSVLGAFGMLPQTGTMDTTRMQNTFNWIWNNWSWHETWGWDFPMTAMTASRLGDGKRAVEALLMPIQTNTYLPNGHNYQEGRLTIYMPGNGGILSAIAMMTAGFDGVTENNPGIPKDDGWKVKWEGLVKMP